MVRHAFTIFTCFLVWVSIIALRTQSLGIDTERIFAIVGSAIAMYTLGYTVHKIITERNDKS
jgi:hypothetical protein